MRLRRVALIGVSVMMATTGCSDGDGSSATPVTSTGSPTTAVGSTGPPATASPVTASPATGSPSTEPPVTEATVPSPEARTLRVSFVDDSRPTSPDGGTGGAPDRTLQTTVYVPRYDGEPAPLIVLAHGFTGHPDKFTDLAGSWADAGFVVAVPKFPLTNDEVPSPQIADLAEQSVDVDFVVDSMLALDRQRSGPVSGRIDATRIGLFGLSLGSLTVWGTLLDGCCAERVDAVIQSDGAFPLAPERLAELRIPVMLAHSDVDGIFPYEQLRAQFEALPAPKYLLTMYGAVHATVGENTPTPADEPYRKATTVFWQRHLAGQPRTPFPDSVVVDGVTRFESATR